jgi:hypothetical protein
LKSARQEVRRQQKTQEWRQRYAARAGVEGTLAEALQLFSLRRCRYVGLAKTRISSFAALQLSAA